MDVLSFEGTRTATTNNNVSKVDDIFKVNQRITIDEVPEKLEIQHERTHKIMHDILR